LAILRAAVQQDGKNIRARLQTVFTQPSFPPRTDVDAMLYDGFIPSQDKQQCAQIIDASASHLREQTWVFKDPRLPELLFRYRARNYPESLSEAESRQWYEHCRTNFADEGAFPLTAFQTALDEECARSDLSPSQRAALEDLGKYAQELLQRLSG